jgi:HTH-type transcriptional regulator, transcriptional repressor of NAD biosynthesis genes
MVPLLFASFIPDLLSFHPLLRVLSAFFAVFTIVFSVLDFNVLLFHEQSTRSLLKWTNDTNDGIALWRRVLMTLSGVASFTGAICVVLVAKGRYSNYLWGIVNCVTYGAFAMAYGYAGDAQLNIIFFLPMQFLGIYIWRRNLDSQNIVKSRRLAPVGWICILSSSLLVGVGFYYEIPAFARALAGSYFFEGMTTPRRLDSATNALSICAQFLMLWRYWEQWLFWISVDVLQIIMYSGAVGVQLNINVLFMFILFLCNAVYGCYCWFRRVDKTESATPTATLNQGPDTSMTGERGFVIGKFLPPHKGHIYLIDTAIQQCSQLYIIVSEHNDRIEWPSAQQRRDFLAKTYPTAKVTIILNQYDEEDSQLWADLCRSWLGFPPDVIFTSEEYGVPFSTCLGSRHVCVDIERKRFPISGTRIRADPFGNWELLTSLAKAVYAIRIVIVGAESTGKTTLAKRLAGHFQTQWVPEVGREVTEAKLASGKYEWTSQDFVDIAVAQSQREDDVAGMCTKILICDTDAFATAIWHERYMNCRSPGVEAIANGKRMPELYLLPEVEGSIFVQDGTRDGEHLREWMFNRFVERMEESRRAFVVLKGDYGKIFQQAVGEIIRVLEGRGLTVDALQRAEN